MRIIKSAHGFSITAATTVRVVFTTDDGKPAAAMYYPGMRAPVVLVPNDPNDLGRIAFFAARREARFTVHYDHIHMW